MVFIREAAADRRAAAQRRTGRRTARVGAEVARLVWTGRQASEA